MSEIFNTDQGSSLKSYGGRTPNGQIGGNNAPSTRDAHCVGCAFIASDERTPETSLHRVNPAELHLLSTDSCSNEWGHLCRLACCGAWAMS